MEANKFDILSNDLEGLIINENLNSQVQKLASLPIDQVFNLKDQTESELGRLFDLLAQQGADLDSQLITPEGFPRSDIDVLQVRLIRRSINMLRNDLKSIIRRAEELMAVQFERMAAKTQTDIQVDYKIPFATITEVVETSPSQIAGFLTNDRIVKLGDVHAGNHKSLSAVGLVVQRNEDKQVPVRILRDGKIHDLILTPSRKWRGPGLLGCRLSQL